MVENLPSGAAYKSLSDGVHVGGSHRGLDHPNSHALGYTLERRAELVVAIAQQDLRYFSVHRCISEWLGCPLLRRVPTSRRIHKLARAQVHDEERIHLPEEDVVRLETGESRPDAI